MSSEQKSPSPEQFKAAQRAGWNNVAQGWKRWWPVFEQGGQALSDRLVELAGIRPGDKVLDIATGIGEPAITAAKRMQNQGQVVAIDISPEMLALAKERAKENGLDRIIAFEESDVETYSYPASAFNAVICRWGVMFFPNFVQTMQKIRNSLVEDGGTLAVAVWSDASKTPMITIPITRGAQAAGIQPPISAGTMGPYRFADTAILRDSLEKAGFKGIQIEKMNLTFTFNSASEVADFHRSVNAPLMAMLKNLPAEKQENAWKAMDGDLKRYADASGRITTNNETIIATASP